jgi:hypothetical protein
VSGASYDLRTFFKSLGRFGAVRALDVSPTERTKSEEDITVFDEKPAAVTGPALSVGGFLDGIQATLCVTHRMQRPVYLYYCAAAVLGEGAKEVGLREALSLLCSDHDAEWLAGLEGGLPIDQLADDTPPELERAAHRLVGLTRDNMERSLVRDLLEEGCDTLVIDGSLTGRPIDARLVGVVKTTASQWLDDESSLWSLEEGFRSARFLVRGKDHVERYSCYLQMTDKADAAWNAGLIRLETFDADLLEPLAVLCLNERQGSLSGDRRWDRHLGSVAAVEKFLRSRRPAVFELNP